MGNDGKMKKKIRKKPDGKNDLLNIKNLKKTVGTYLRMKKYKDKEKILKMPPKKNTESSKHYIVELNLKQKDIILIRKEK